MKEMAMRDDQNLSFVPSRGACRKAGSAGGQESQSRAATRWLNKLHKQAGIACGSSAACPEPAAAAAAPWSPSPQPLLRLVARPSRPKHRLSAWLTAFASNAGEPHMHLPGTQPASHRAVRAHARRVPATPVAALPKQHRSACGCSLPISQWALATWQQPAHAACGHQDVAGPLLEYRRQKSTRECTWQMQAAAQDVSPGWSAPYTRA